LKSLKKSSYPHEYLFKASWRATSLMFKVEAQNEAQAYKRAEGKVFRMEGGVNCMEVKLISQLR
jgi:hypothetical protein